MIFSAVCLKEFEGLLLSFAVSVGRPMIVFFELLETLLLCCDVQVFESVIFMFQQLRRNSDEAR